MSDITDAGPRLRLINDALEQNDRLRTQIDEMNAEIARLLITDEERSALKWFARLGQPKHHAAALARLLERMETGEK